VSSAQIFVSFRRDITDRRYVLYVIRKSWWVRPSLANPKGVTRTKVIAEGRFQHPDAVDDIDILIGDLAENLQPHSNSKSAHVLQGAPVPATQELLGQLTLPFPRP
jgi:hypothetical protein